MTSCIECELGTYSNLSKCITCDDGQYPLENRTPSNLFQDKHNVRFVSTVSPPIHQVAGNAFQEHSSILPAGHALCVQKAQFNHFPVKRVAVCVKPIGQNWSLWNQVEPYALHVPEDRLHKTSLHAKIVQWERMKISHIRASCVHEIHTTTLQQRVVICRVPNVPPVALRLG